MLLHCITKTLHLTDSVPLEILDKTFVFIKKDLSNIYSKDIIMSRYYALVILF